MSNNTQILLLAVILIAIAGSVRMRYMQARETGQTRSSIPLRDRAGLLARLRLRLTWFFFPACAGALWLWFTSKPSAGMLTLAAAGVVIAGSVIFDAMLLRTWAKNPPASWRKHDISSNDTTTNKNASTSTDSTDDAK